LACGAPEEQAAFQRGAGIQGVFAEGGDWLDAGIRKPDFFPAGK
jgi:hypothetical protein